MKAAEAAGACCRAASFALRPPVFLRRGLSFMAAQISTEKVSLIDRIIVGFVEQYVPESNLLFLHLRRSSDQKRQKTVKIGRRRKGPLFQRTFYAKAL